jgi:hypothetical protein
LFSAPIPSSGLRIAPTSRISNASQPTPSDIIGTTKHHTLLKGNDLLEYNTPTRTLQLHYTCEVDSKLRSLKITDSNVRKRPFSISQPYKRLRRPLDSIDVLTRPCPLRTGLVGCKYTKKFLIANDFCKKLAENVASFRNNAYLCPDK